MPLTGYERRILQKFAETLFPVTDRLPETPDDVGLIERVERHLSFVSRNLRLAFRGALFLFQWAGVFLGGRPFTLLSNEKRERYLERWRVSLLYFFRLLFKLIESICYFNYYSHPAVNRRVGFEPPPIQRRGERLRVVEDPEEDLFLKTDVCVIGSGAGGAVVAKELSERGRSVVILEEGGNYDIGDFGKEPLEIVQRLYRNAGLQVTIGFPAILLPTGKAVGGTTIINSGTCLRLPEKILLRWQEEFGLTDLTPQALAPYFDRVEQTLHVTPVGEEILGTNARIFRRGLEKLGLQGAPLPRDVRDCRGSGMCCFGCPTDAKQSVHLSYLPRAIEKGARLVVRCRADGLFPRQEHGGEVVGQFLDREGKKTGKNLRVEAKAIVLAAGTLNTPRLLKRNHIAIFNRHIGRHLTIHPASKVVGLFDEEVRGWEGVPQGYSYHGMAEEGILFEGVFTPPSFGSSNTDLPHRLHREMMGEYSHVASFGFMITDGGRGQIRWLPNGDPLVFYSIRRDEVAKFFKAIRFLTEVFLAAGARKVFPGLRGLPVVTPEMGLQAFEGIKVRRGDLGLAGFHPLGTCRMGSDPDHSVVNSYGEMHYVKNLFVADGSIFPTALGVNPQETIMAFAHRTADLIDAERL